MLHHVWDLCFTETMATGERMSNGYQLRRRSIPPQLQSPPKVVIPSSLMNINEPAKSEALMEQFIVKMKRSETRKVYFTLDQQMFDSWHQLFFCSKIVKFSRCRTYSNVIYYSGTGFHLKWKFFRREHVLGLLVRKVALEATSR